jgi:hypothetical protein
VCKAAGQHLTSPQHRTVRLSQPLPLQAREQARQQWAAGLLQLSSDGKDRLLSAAARSGSEVNLEVACSVMQPYLNGNTLDEYARNPDLDPTTAAAAAGHTHLLPWLVARPWPHHPHHAITAALRHSTLAACQQACQLMRPGCTYDICDIRRLLCQAA